MLFLMILQMAVCLLLADSFFVCLKACFLLYLSDGFFALADGCLLNLNVFCLVAWHYLSICCFFDDLMYGSLLTLISTLFKDIVAMYVLYLRIWYFIIVN